MKNYFDVSGRYAVMTGASSGLGRQFALCLAEQGANVAIMARRVEKLEEVRAEVERHGVRCLDFAHKVIPVKYESARLLLTRTDGAAIRAIRKKRVNGAPKPTLPPRHALR